VNGYYPVVQAVAYNRTIAAKQFGLSFYR